MASYELAGYGCTLRMYADMNPSLQDQIVPHIVRILSKKVVLVTLVIAFSCVEFNLMQSIGPEVSATMETEMKLTKTMYRYKTDYIYI